MTLRDILRNARLHALLADAIGSEEAARTGEAENAAARKPGDETPGSAKARELASRSAGEPPENDYASICLSIAQQLDSRDFVLPVMGVQGSGKSTILNSICFNEPVLPIDADETTAVPVEISRQASPQPVATVTYKDGRTETIPAAQESLNLLVHHAHNKGNVKGVTGIRVESRADFLEDGLVLVDLPGLGSLTPENQKTTQDYLKKAVGIICVIMTSPPLRESEAIQIQAHWATKRLHMYFAQNVWDDIDDKQLKEGLEYNLDVLKNIADKLKITSGGDSQNGSPIKIYPINAFRSLEDSLKSPPPNGDQVTGAGPLKDLIRRLGKSWKADSAENARRETLSFMDRSLESLARRRESLSRDRETATRELESHRDRMKAELAEFEALHDETNSDLRRLGRDLRAICSDWENEEGGRLRSRMRELVYNGVTDGDRLNSAFSDYSKDSYDNLIERVQVKVSDFEREIIDKYSRLVDESLRGKKVDHAFSRAEGSIHGEEGERLREFAPFAGMAGLGAGGVLVPILLTTNPAGWIVAAAGVVGAILGSFLGGKTKEMLDDEQKSKIASQIPAKVAEFTRKISESVAASIADFAKDYETAFRRRHETQKTRIESDYLKGQEDIGKSEDEKKALLARVESDMAWLTSLKGEAASAAP
ncbi:MAG: dynamin family protein [Deltaproteobacteria bacterium]|nr:dynamin family protein [Deltaproteobacteria bacterium]